MFRHFAFRKNLFYSFIIVPFIIGACNKDEHPSDSQYFIRFKADLTRIVFTDQPVLIANFSESGGQHNCLISGGDRTSSITLQIVDDSIISLGSYYGVGISYKDDNGIIFEQDNANFNSAVTITELTATSVRGAFYGAVSAIGSTIAISEGEFHVRRDP